MQYNYYRIGDGTLAGIAVAVAAGVVLALVLRRAPAGAGSWRGSTGRPSPTTVTPEGCPHRAGP